MDFPEMLRSLVPREAERREAEGEEGIEEALNTFAARAKSAWERDLPLDAFLASAGEKLAHGPWVPALRALQATDLGVAWGAVHGDPRAATALAAAMREARPALFRAGASTEAVQEIEQDVIASIVVARGDRSPELLDYSGRGPLAAWLRVVAVRRAHRSLRRDRKNVDVDEVLLERAAAVPDVAAIVGKLRDRAAVGAALKDALEALDARERTLLKYQILDGLGVTEVGAIYGVHRATAARWLADARTSLASTLRRLLGQRLRLTEVEIESLVGFVGSQVDVSVERLLRGDRKP